MPPPPPPPSSPERPRLNTAAASHCGCRFVETSLAGPPRHHPPRRQRLRIYHACTADRVTNALKDEVILQQEPLRDELRPPSVERRGRWEMAFRWKPVGPSSHSAGPISGAERQ